MQSLLDDQMKQKLCRQERARQADNLANSKRPSTRRLFGLFQRWFLLVWYCDNQMHCHVEDWPWSVYETQTHALCFFVVGNANQASTPRKPVFFNYSYKRNVEVADKSKVKGIFVKSLSYCVRQCQNFAGNTVVVLGCSEDLDTYRALHRQANMTMHNNDSCKELPATCNRSIVSSLCIILSLALVCRVFVHIGLFIYSLHFN